VFPPILHTLLRLEARLIWPETRRLISPNVIM
jgi:hypothetical protein